MKNNKVSIDSNALSYLVDVMMNDKKPMEKEADEKIALFRVYLYREDNLYVSPTVRAEYEKIKDEQKRRDHQEITDILLGDISVSDHSLIKTRTKEYNKFHSGKKNEKDCKILAESEIGGCNLILTYDQDFYNKLNNKTHTIKIMKPSDFWVSLGIPQNSEMKKEPSSTNPHSKETWYVW